MSVTFLPILGAPMGMAVRPRNDHAAQACGLNAFHSLECSALNVPQQDKASSSIPTSGPMPLIGPSSPKSDPRIAQYLPLASSFARRYAGALRSYTFDDLLAIAMEALWRATESWVAERGASFVTYAGHCITHAFWLEIKRVRAQRRIPVRQLQSTSPLTADDGFADLPSDAKTPEEILSERAVKGTVTSLMRGLDTRRKLVIRRRYQAGATLEQIGAELGVTRERARQLEVEALGKMRRVLAGRGGR